MCRCLIAFYERLIHNEICDFIKKGNNCMSEIDENYEDICMMCRRSESQAGKMFKMPGNICLCNDCMHATMDAVNNMGIDPSMFQGDPMMGFGNMPFNSADSGTFKDRGDINLNEIEMPSNEPKNDVKSDGNQEEPSEKENNEPDDENKKGVPRFSFINMADFPGNMFFPGQKVKKKKKGEHKPLIELKDIPAPHKIKAMLDEHVVGQEKAKKIMSVAVYNHYKRVATDSMDDIEIEKSNILMIGPTGCGKTYLVRTLAKILNVPLAITDATSLTEAGYIGDDIESVVSKLLAAADNDVDKCEQGIIYIDEIDKLAKKENSHSRDVNGESVQQGMLKLLEGSEIEVPIGSSSKNAMVPTATVNTKNILFICGGAFSGLEEIIKKRLSSQTSIGFKADLKDKFDNDKNLVLQATVEDIKKYGMIPEFVGRLPMFITLEGLTCDMLVDVLKEPKNAILKQYQKLLKLDEVNLVFEDDALKAIAEKAAEKETGARALRAVLDEFMVDIMYEIPKDDNIGTVTITRDYIEGKGGPKIEMRSI